MRITAVRKQKRHLTEIILENGETLMLDNDICSDYSLKEDSDIDIETINEIQYQSDYARAKSRALWYLDRADYTEKKLYDKLIKTGFEKRASAAVIARLTELGLVNDRRYAENFAARCKEANISKRESVFKMITNGVPRDLAMEVADSIETNEEDMISELIAKKYRNKLLTENGTEKVYAALIRKGFSFGAVRNALKKYSEQLEFSEE